MAEYKNISRWQFLKRYLISLNNQAAVSESRHYCQMVETNRQAVVIDLGCGPKIHFEQSLIPIVRKIKPKKVIACDIVSQFVNEAKKEGFEGKIFDFSQKFPLKDKSADVVFANQIIEHLQNQDHFLEEIYRVLKDEGYLLIGTENLASWYNILALVLGYQPFILTEISRFGPIGNPFSLHRGGCLIDYSFPEKSKEYLQHIKVLAYQGLIELLNCHGFEIEEIFGSGYYPAPVFLANILTEIDTRHANRLQMKARKKHV